VASSTPPPSTLAAIGLVGVVALVGALAVTRDPATVDALESEPIARSPSAPVAASGSPSARPSSRASAGGSAALAPSSDSPVAKLLPALVTAPTEELDRALTLPQVAALAQTYPTDPKVLVKLARLQSLSPNGLHDAVVTSKQALALSPEAATLPELRQVILRGASGPPLTADLAFGLMTDAMGHHGADLIYELTVAKSVSKPIRDRALALTKSEALRKRASPALRVALELRDVSGCGRKKFFDQAEKDGDARSLTHLVPLTATKGCGVFKLADCFDECINRVDLNRVIKTIRSRGGG
jgi:hypothetical protein